MKLRTVGALKKRIASLLGIISMLSLMLGSVGAENVFASGLSSGTGATIPGEWVEFNYIAQKTIDLSNSDIKIELTQAEKDALREETDESALAWVYKTMALQSSKDIRQADPSGNDYDNLVKKYGLYEKYWYDTLDVGSIDIDPADQANVNKIINTIQAYGTASKFIAIGDAAIDQLLGLGFDGAMINGKINEIYNDKQSDLLVSKIASALPVKVEFSLVPLKNDGSEDSEYGVDGSTIQRGQLKGAGNSQKFSTVDFGDANQFYDEILNKGMEQYIATSKNTSTKDGSIIIGDNRNLMDHLMFIDGAELVSSDQSQNGAGVKRGDINYPGTHTLLEVSDSLALYAWARYAQPGIARGGEPGYVATFNLHLNPAVTYMATDVKEDLITDARFDSSGRLLTVSKGIAAESDIKSFMAKNNIDTNAADGTYRFKLVETGVTPEVVDGNIFFGNEDSKIVDVEIVNHKIDGIAIYEDAKAAGSGDAGAEFVNYFNKKPHVEKTIEGSSELKLEKLDQPFRYRISTVIPKGVSSFEIEDNLEKVLEFTEDTGTVIKIDGTGVSAADKAKMLKQTDSSLNVDLDSEQIDKNGGKELAVEFTVKIKKGANLGAYKGKKVPNIAKIKINDEFETNTIEPAVVIPPSDVQSVYDIDDEDDATPTADTNVINDEEGDDASTTTANTVGVKTGDSAPIAGAIAALIAAGGAFVAIRRRRSN